MLSKNNFTEEHIRSLQTESRRDPLLLERCVYAFGLLEAIITVGMPFVFKGGTSLMLYKNEKVNSTHLSPSRFYFCIVDIFSFTPLMVCLNSFRQQ